MYKVDKSTILFTVTKFLLTEIYSSVFMQAKYLIPQTRCPVSGKKYSVHTHRSFVTCTNCRGFQSYMLMVTLRKFASQISDVSHKQSFQQTCKIIYLLLLADPEL